MAFHQIKLAPGSRIITAFAGPNGLYQFLKRLCALSVCIKSVSSSILEQFSSQPFEPLKHHNPRRVNRAESHLFTDPIEVAHSFPFTMAVGYPERGRRAGVRTRAEQTRKQFNIPVISSPRFQYANPHLTRGVNFNNLLAVSKTKPSHQNRASVHFIPR